MLSNCQCHPWREIELVLTARKEHAEPYVSVEVWADFTHSDGTVLRRPAFWDGGNIWKIRFASTKDNGEWRWTTGANVSDPGLAPKSGILTCAAVSGSGNRFHTRGFWRMSPGGRNLVHADGTPCLLVADTPWALPWRATIEQCKVYAADRAKKGFNAALLMSVQPDMRAVGPRDRVSDEGFDVGFEDLPQGHINQINVSYFQYFDKLVDILVSHEIVPVYNPVFQGFGWKGLGVAGIVVPPAEYARYCRYLVARYGARPAVYLVSADGSGRDPQVPAGGEEIEKWDCYGQPTGIHYAPHTDNRAFQDAKWLDFQWCQTGHHGEHVPERVADMWRNNPPKGVANGEPTYEFVGRSGSRASGWWQGHEAWCNLCAGGTMGVVYGADSLWNWKRSDSEPGREDWASAKGAGWREALDFEGSSYVGVISKIFEGLPFTDMEPNWTFSISRRSLAVPGKLYIAYISEGHSMYVTSDKVPPAYRILDPRNGKVIGTGMLEKGKPSIDFEPGIPRVIIFCSEF